MHQDDREIGVDSSPDYDSALCVQQTVLLNRIDVLTCDTAIKNPSENEQIYVLKQEYNELVKKRAKLARSPLSDPMEVLPSELWPDIIRNIVDESRYPVNKLLDLISVSKGWCSLLTTLPVIWTHIQLDQSEPDYLAKAVICIQLSGECEIEVIIRHLTVDEWQGISSMIVPEDRRIRQLRFDMHDPDSIVTRQVLGDFTKLPVLQELFLPTRPSQVSDQQYIHALIMEKMPLIKRVFTPGGTMQDLTWNPHLTTCFLEAKSLTKEAVETLMLVPHLQFLRYVETAQTLENIPSLLKSLFGSITTFSYAGTDICRRLTWIGNNLSTLSTHYPENGDATALLVALSRFPRLHELTINALSWAQPIQTNNHIAIPHNSIRVLSLEAFDQDQIRVDWAVLFSMFLAASPSLENLSVRSGMITDAGWNSIQSLKNLLFLNIDECNIDDSSSMLLNIESLRWFELSVDSHSLAQLLARLQSKFLQILQLTGIESYIQTVTPTPYIVAGAAFPNITSLAITTGSRIILELRALSKLKHLKLQRRSLGAQIMYWESDVLEAILMRPRDNPALEKITFTGKFIEWDILLLMLERRNFLNEIGISSIKALVVDYDLPYRLLYPLSELLGGRYVVRDTDWLFSLDAIGERILDESIPGCIQCHSRFRECESLLLPRREIRHKEPTGGDKEYRLANEYLVADPPLSLEMKLWLSGRRERLIEFMLRYEETRGQVRRLLWCGTGHHDGNVITGDILAGVHFGHDLQEYDTRNPTCGADQNEVEGVVYVDSTGYN